MSGIPLPSFKAIMSKGYWPALHNINTIVINKCLVMHNAAFKSYQKLRTSEIK